MITVKNMALALILDGIMTQIPQQVKERPYMVKLYRTMNKKNISLSRNHGKDFDDAFHLAEATGRAVVKTGKDFASISRAIQFLLEREPWLIKFYKLNPKHLEKMYSAFVSDDVIFRSSQMATAIVTCLNAEHAHYQFNKEKSL